MNDNAKMEESLRSFGVDELMRQKFTDVFNDFLNLDKKIAQTRDAFTEVIDTLPDAIDGRISEKLHLLLKTAEELNLELTEGKNDLQSFTLSLMMDFNRQVAIFIGSLDKEIAAILDNYKNALEAECAKIKKLTSSAKPVSFMKTVLVSFFSVAVVTVVINSVSLYFTSRYFDYKLYAYAAAYKQLSELMEKNIKYLPKDKQEVVNAEFKVIKNKPSP